MFSNLVISFDELWLKGKNRMTYMRAAMDHINAVFKHYHQDKFSYRIQSERLYYTSKTFFSEELLDALILVPGVAYISPCKMINRLPEESLENVYEEILNELISFDKVATVFKALVKRVDKTFSQTSVLVGREIGHRILKRYPLSTVDMKKAEVVVDVRILAKHVSISTESRRGIGGLPWGSTGSAVTLLSGGFDSPVASFLMAKRGVKQAFIFFHAYPFVGREVLAKIKSLVSVLGKYQKQSHLYIVPFGDIQSLISKDCREEYRTLIFRRYMIEISNMIAQKIKAEALITGDCVGQVSSQTMPNLHLMDKISERMILRPLVGYNKLEILNTARAINTHDLSLIAHDDACSLFSSKKPIIIPNIEYWNHWKDKFDFTNELKLAIEKTESFSINLKGELFKKDFFSIDG